MDGWLPDNFAVIHKMIDTPAGCAAFDFDNTLIYNDLGEACMNYLALQGNIHAEQDEFWENFKHPLISLKEEDQLKDLYLYFRKNNQRGYYLNFIGKLFGYYERIAEQASVEDAYRWSRIFFAGNKESELESVARYIFKEELNKPIGIETLPSGMKLNRGMRIYREIHGLIQLMLETNWEVHVVTASPEPIVRAVVDYWGIPPDAVSGMKLVCSSEDEILHAQIIEPMTYGKGKVQALESARKARKNQELPVRFAAGDSRTDYEMLKHAEISLLIDRGDARLREDALSSGIMIQPQFAVE